MYKLRRIINNQLAVLNINLKEETSKTIIAHLIPDCNYEINSIMPAIDNLAHLVNQHYLFQKPIIELHLPNCLVGRFLDEIASRMSNTTKNTFNKLRIIDAYRIFEYDGWDWKLISTVIRN